MGRDRKKSLDEILDCILIDLENGNVPENIKLNDLNFSQLKEEEKKVLLNKVECIIEKIKEIQKEIIKNISNKTQLKSYRF